MNDEPVHVTCPFCGESVDLLVEADVLGSFVQDCEVCCNPWLVRISWDEGRRSVTVLRDDGSE